MKKLFCITVSLLLLTSLFSCNNRDTVYRDDISCAEILENASEQLPIDLGYKSLGGEHKKYYFDNTRLDDDCAFLGSVASEDINEIGIFHAPTLQAREELLELCEDYLEDYLEEKEAFIASYAPAELEKLKNAEARAFGNYVAYAILSKDDRALFFDTVEKLLLE